MRSLLLTLALAVSSSMTIRAQELSEGSPSGAAQIQRSDAIAEDTIPAAVKRRLLPDNMSFMERGMWGENGFFREIGIAGPLTPENRKEELTARRAMLTMHQIGGIVTFGAMATAVWYGQKTLDHPSVRQYRQWHQLAVTTTIITYSATGLLAALSPPPYIRRDEVSTTSIHKTLAWIHFGGMVLTPILGSMLHRGRSTSYGQLAHFHQASAYITTAAMAASLIVITF